MRFAAALFLVAAGAGVLSSDPKPQTPAVLGTYRVLTADFHVHMFPLDDSTLAPWDAVAEARRRGLDVIALTGHNQAWTAKIGRWYAQRTGGPLVLVGEEIVPHSYHLIAAGIEQSIDWHGTAAQSIAEIHRQGGVAIAAHPLRQFWPAYDEAAMRELDGAEVLHPMAFAGAEYAEQFREFYKRKPMAAIGSSDFHGIGFEGFSHTYVFVPAGQAVNEQDVLDAIRARRTVAVAPGGVMYGDPNLMRLVQANGGLPPSGVVPHADGWALLSRLSAIAAMLLAGIFLSTSGGYTKGLPRD